MGRAVGKNMQVNYGYLFDQAKFSALEKAAVSEKMDKKAKASQQEVSAYIMCLSVQGLSWFITLLSVQAHYRSACDEVLEPLMESMKQLHPAKVWEDLNCRLYTTFWVMSTYDLHAPTGRYDEEIGRAKQAISDLETSSDLVQYRKLSNFSSKNYRNNVRKKKVVWWYKGGCPNRGWCYNYCICLP